MSKNKQSIKAEEIDEVQAFEPSEVVKDAPKGMVVIPLILAPIVADRMCQRAGVARSVDKCRNAVTDPVDGREWSVSWEGGEADIVCHKSGGSSSQEQVYSQYDRLREAKAKSNHTAKGYTEAYAKQKDTDTPELRESTRAAVEKIVAESDVADRLFAEFEQAHPECLLKRYTGEIAQWTTKVKAEELQVKRYEESCDGWKQKIKDTPDRDDNLKESLAACESVLEQHKAKLAGFKKSLADVEKLAEKVEFSPVEVETIVVPMGAAVCFQ